jgi:hypothetical protein
MASDGYERDLQSPELGPPWMHGPWGNKFWGAFGKVLDAQNELMRSARKASMPAGALALGMSDALDRQGDDRLLPRGGSVPTASDESDAAYATRLQKVWTTWGQDDTPVTGKGGGAGSVLAILTQLKIAGFPIEPTGTAYWTTGAFLINHIGRVYDLINGVLHVVGSAPACANRQNLDGTVSGILPGFTLDARDQFYSHFCLLFVQDVSSLVNTPCPAKSRLNAICKRWKSGSAIYNGCVIVPSASSAKCLGWPFDMKFGDSGLTFGTNSARFIAPE